MYKHALFCDHIGLILLTVGFDNIVAAFRVFVNRRLNRNHSTLWGSIAQPAYLFTANLIHRISTLHPQFTNVLLTGFGHTGLSPVRVLKLISWLPVLATNPIVFGLRKRSDFSFIKSYSCRYYETTLFARASPTRSWSLFKFGENCVFS